MSDKETCGLDYENEYHRQQAIICELTEENGKLKNALINLALNI